MPYGDAGLEIRKPGRKRITEMKVSLGDARLSYMGRIDRKDREKPEFIFPATSLSFCFWGKKAELTIENRRACWDNYVGAIVDGRRGVATS